MKTFHEFISEAKKCWPGYKKKGTQKLFGKTYNRCVKEESDTESKEAKKCPDGKYWCFDSKKCKKIPKGWHVMRNGYLMKDEDHEDDENGESGNNGSSDGGGVSESWSAKYKKSIDCDNPKGFSQRAHCQGRKKKKIKEEFKQMPGELMNKQMNKLSKSQSDLRKGKQTEKKRNREIKYDMQMKSIQMAGKQDYNRKGESYGQFWQDPLKTGKIRNHRFR